VACRSQDNPRRTVPDGVPHGVANLGFRRLSCPRRLDRPPPQAVRLARAGSFGKWISDNRAILRIRVFDRKKRQHTFGDSAGDRSGFAINLSIFAWDHSATSTKRT
jgi:hypothetical protein